MLAYHTDLPDHPDMIRARKMLKSVDDKRHTCLYSDCSELFSRVPIQLDCTCSLVVDLLHASDWFCINTALRMTVDKLLDIPRYRLFEINDHIIQNLLMFEIQ